MAKTLVVDDDPGVEAMFSATGPRVFKLKRPLFLRRFQAIRGVAERKAGDVFEQWSRFNQFRRNILKFGEFRIAQQQAEFTIE